MAGRASPVAIQGLDDVMRPISGLALGRIVRLADRDMTEVLAETILLPAGTYQNPKRATR